MKIIKFTEFIKEELVNDTPESYIEVALKQIKRKIDKMFEFQEEGDFSEEGGEEQEKTVKKAKIDSRKNYKFIKLVTIKYISYPKLILKIIIKILS